jgi:hypothetical protein
MPQECLQNTAVVAEEETTVMQVEVLYMPAAEVEQVGRVVLQVERVVLITLTRPEAAVREELQEIQELRELAEQQVWEVVEEAELTAEEE